MPENTPFAAANISFAMLARAATAPMRMKSGTTESEYALASSKGTEAIMVRALRQPSIAA